VKQALVSNVEPLTPQVNSLQAEVRGLRTQIDTGNIAYSQMSLARLSTAASSMRSKVSSEVDKVNSPIGDLFSSVNAIDENLKIAENTLGLFGQANFPLKEDESPVLAFEGKILKGDKSEGTLFFTNQRFIFEAKKEVVLEKKLFIVTKKKTERTVVINQPIGAIQEITKGRVGFLAWTGIFVKFKSSSGQEETQFDVEGSEADIIKRFFGYLINGEADKDIAKIRGTTTTAAPTKQLVQCPRCFAPYTREVYKGQKTVQCEYCGTQIVIQ
jgi:DNA-directed RNA polymerase subunit RPC12/RpoP